MATKLRGAMVCNFLPAADVQALVAQKVNLIRYPIVTNSDNPILIDPAAWTTFVNAHIAHIQTVVIPNMGEAHLCIDMHNPAGGLVNGKARLFTESGWKELFISLWEAIASTFKNHPRVWGYDILNEPAGTATQVNALMKYAVARIRKIDSRCSIMVSPPYGLHRGFSDAMYIRGYNKIVYTAHMYAPMQLTHAGIMPQYPLPAPVYPGASNKATLDKSLQTVRTFQKRWDARIYVGEFSCGVPAGEDARAAYLSDCISIFEKYGWEWSYHAWREFSGWDAEPYPKVFGVLQRGWSKNS